MEDKVIIKTAIFHAELVFLEAMMHWLQEQLVRARLNISDKRKVEIAVEEALVNIIHYAYLKRSGTIEMRCYIFPDEQIKIMIKDWGIPFDVKKKANPINCFTPLEERSLGGLGIPLIHELMDEIEYERQGIFNILTLKKNL